MKAIHGVCALVLLSGCLIVPAGAQYNGNSSDNSSPKSGSKNAKSSDQLPAADKKFLKHSPSAEKQAPTADVELNAIGEARLVVHHSTSMPT